MAPKKPAKTANKKSSPPVIVKECKIVRTGGKYEAVDYQRLRKVTEADTLERLHTLIARKNYRVVE